MAITLGVISGQMKFTQTTITARPGQRVEITLNNTDDMPHNIVIFRRGTIAEYEKELFGSLNEPNAQLRGFVPDSPNVLVASRLLNAGESTVVTFDAPTEPGDAPVRVFVPRALGDDARRAQDRMARVPFPSTRGGRWRNHQGLENGRLLQPLERTDGHGVVRRRQRMGGIPNFCYRAAA